MSLALFAKFAARILRRAKITCYLFLLILGAVIVESAQAQATTSAESVAKNFVLHLEAGSFGDIYDEDLGPTFKQGVKKDMFVSQMGMMKIQNGGSAQARQLIGGQAFSQTPNGLTGEFYYVRFKTKFPSGMVFQDVYLEKVSGVWKVSGYWMFPAPSI